MFVQLYESEPHLQTPQARAASWETLQPSEYFELPRDLVERVAEMLPLQKLKEAVDTAEQTLNNRKKAIGIQPTGCGGTDTFGADSEFAHTLEHALIAVLDFNSPTDEAGIGATVVAGIAKESPADTLEVNHRYKVYIAPPPSMEITQAKRLTYLALEKMTHGGEPLDLENIAKSIRNNP